MIVRTWGAPFESQGKAVLRPYTFGGEWFGQGEAEFKPRDLRNDGGYRVAVLRSSMKVKVQVWASAGGASLSPPKSDQGGRREVRLRSEEC